MNTAISDNSNINLANCVFQPTKNGAGVSGTVYFTQYNGFVSVIASVRGLNNSVSKRGFHIHSFGDLRDPSGPSIGAHFNPFEVDHASPPTENRHVGDLGNLQFVDANGTSWYNGNYSELALSGPNSIIGRAVAIHSSPDDGCTQRK